MREDKYRATVERNLLNAIRYVRRDYRNHLESKAKEVGNTAVATPPVKGSLDALLYGLLSTVDLKSAHSARSMVPEMELNGTLRVPYSRTKSGLGIRKEDESWRHVIYAIMAMRFVERLKYWPWEEVGKVEPFSSMDGGERMSYFRFWKAGKALLQQETPWPTLESLPSTLTK